VPVETVRAMLSERNLTLATMSEARAADKVRDAMQRGYLSPAMKPWAPGTGHRKPGIGRWVPGTGYRVSGAGYRALAPCRTDQASFDSFLQSTVPPFAHLLRSGMDHRRTPPAPPPASVRGPALGSDVAEALCAAWPATRRAEGAGSGRGTVGACHGMPRDMSFLRGGCRGAHRRRRGAWRTPIAGWRPVWTQMVGGGGGMTEGRETPHSQHLAVTSPTPKFRAQHP